MFSPKKHYVATVVIGNINVCKEFNNIEDSHEWVNFVNTQIEAGNSQILLKMLYSYTPKRIKPILRKFH